MIFKPGDTVFVKENAWSIRPSNGDLIQFDSSQKMRQYCGKAMVVKEFVPSARGLERYTLEDCGQMERFGRGWLWAEEWLEPYSEIEDVSDSDMMDLFK